MKKINISSPKLDSRQLNAFVAVAYLNNLSKAGKELGLTPSAMSHCMKALEEDMGCILLTRMGKTTLLTQAGEQLLVHAEKILHEMELARASILQLNKWTKGHLRLGASDSACQYIMPGVIREFKKQFPDCLVSIEPSDTPEALKMIHEGTIDLAFVLAPEKEGHFETQNIFFDELYFMVGPDHPWAKTGVAVPEEIARQQYILYQTKSYTFQMVTAYFRSEGIILNRVMEIGNMEAIKEMVKLGLGISIMTPWIAREELEDKSLVKIPLGKKRLKRTWCVVYGQDHQLNHAEETFIGSCRTTVG